MKALVTGATGFIGSAIVRELLKDGVEVKALVRKGSDTRNIGGLDVEQAYGDIRDKDSVKAALKGCNTFYQAAALYAVRGVPEEQFYDINVEGTRAALTAALEQGMEKVVYTSSIAAVGCCTEKKPVDENTIFNLGKLGIPYVTTKYLGEQAAMEFARRGLPLVMVNPAVVVGVRDVKPTPSGQIVLNILNGKYPAYPDGGANFVDVEDVARGHVLAAQKGKIGQRYILGNANMTVGEFFRLVGEVAGVTVPARKIPASVMVSLGYVSQFVSAVARKPATMDAKSARFACAYTYCDCSKAVTELGMPQTPIRTTVEKAVDWFTDNGYVVRRTKR